MKSSVRICLSIVIIGLLMVNTGCIIKSDIVKKQKDNGIKYEKWIDDIEQIDSLLDTVVGVNVRFSGEERKGEINQLKKDIKHEELSDTDIYFRVCEILSDIKINHIQLEGLDEIYDKINKYYFPVAGQWFGKDYYIIAADNENEDTIGGKLVSINGVSFEEVCKRYDSIIINETEMDFRYKFFCHNNQWGFKQEELKYLDIIKNNEATFVVNKDNKDIEVKLKSVKADDFESGKVKMVSISDKMTSRPLRERVYIESKKAPFSYYHDMDNKVMYFQYMECFDKTQENEEGLEDRVKDFPVMTLVVDEMINYMKEHEDMCEQFIFDLRNNSGGKTYLIENAFDKHIEYLKDKNIKVLIGNNISAGHTAVEYLLEKFPNVKLYGEESSSFIYNFTDVPSVANYELKNCKWRFKVPSYMWYGQNLCKRQDDWEVGILPDYEVCQTYEDYINGIDTVYNYAINN